MIFYALIGIPVNGFLFAYLGDFFGKTVSNKMNNISSYQQFIKNFLAVYRNISSLQNLQNTIESILFTKEIGTYWTNRTLSDPWHCVLHFPACLSIHTF